MVESDENNYKLDATGIEGDGKPMHVQYSAKFDGKDLSLAKMLAGRRINDLQPWFGPPSAITLAHGQPVFALVRSTRSPFS